MPHHVVTLAVDDTSLFELGVATEVFGFERPEIATGLYEYTLCARDRRARLEGGLELPTAAGLEALADADTVLVPNGAPRGTTDPVVLDALRDAHGRGARIVSFCTAAFTLAEAGLLDGRCATTHWKYADLFRARFPRVRLDPNVLFVDEGDVLTSAGSAAGLDLALHLVRADHGAGIAAAIARHLVVPPHREGGQAQYIDPPHQPLVDGDRLAEVLEQVTRELHEDIGVPEMAARAAMSERTFARRFKEATGTTPFRWLLSQRLQRARQLLETTDLDVDRIASRAGLGTAANLRDHFRRELGTTPTAYRRAFRGGAADPAAVRSA